MFATLTRIINFHVYHRTEEMEITIKKERNFNIEIILIYIFFNIEDNRYVRISKFNSLWIRICLFIQAVSLSRLLSSRTKLTLFRGVYAPSRFQPDLCFSKWNCTLSSLVRQSMQFLKPYRKISSIRIKHRGTRVDERFLRTSLKGFFNFDLVKHVV